jgi:DNA mismatch repair protein MutS
MVHDGTINVNGFIATSKGLELHYTMVKEDSN